MAKQHFKKAIIFLIIIIGLIALDQITKEAAVANLKGSDPYVIIDNIFELLYVENRGAAFGIMNGWRSFFLLLAPIVALALFAEILYIPLTRHYLPMIICLTGIASGAIGNFIDRFRQAYVVDFLYFKPIDFPVFNVADIYVTCSVFLLMYLIIFYYSDDDLNTMNPLKK